MTVKPQRASRATGGECVSAHVRQCFARDIDDVGVSSVKVDLSGTDGCLLQALKSTIAVRQEVQEKPRIGPVMPDSTIVGSVIGIIASV